MNPITQYFSLPIKPDSLTRQRAVQFVLLGTMATLFVAFSAIMLQKYLGISTSSSDALAAGCVAIAAYRFTGEVPAFGKLSVIMVVGGVLLGCVAHYLFFTNVHVSGALDVDPYATTISLINLSLVTPFFEELVVRGLLFRGLSQLIGAIASGVIVSVLFALFHPRVMVFAFLVSIFLCYLAYRNVDTFNRFLFHGSYNLLFLLLSLWPFMIQGSG